MLTSKDLGAAIGKAIELKGVPKTVVADHFGIKGPSIYDWIKHGRIGKQHLTELVAYFSDVVGPDHWGLPLGDSPSDADWCDVRASEQAVSLGDGSAPDEYAETHRLKFKTSSLRKKGLRPHLLEVYYGSGDSMETRIHDGDAILFDTSDKRIVDNAIYVIRHEGHVYAKRLQTLGDQLVVIVSDNRSDPRWRKPVLVRSTDDFEVLGRVRWIGSWED